MPSTTPKQVGEKLNGLIKKYGLQDKLTVDKIKEMIFNDSGESAIDGFHIFQKKINRYFKAIKNFDELNGVLQVFVDAWNYFPHKFLKGKSPQEMAEQLYGKDVFYRKKKRDQKEKMPDVVVGDRKFTWDEYGAFIARMEKAQEPFKQWAKTEMLPKYKKYLKTISKSASRRNTDYRVAGLFLARVWHVGFVEPEQIRADFIQKEFPKWWQTHVMDSYLSETEVLASLERLFVFLDAIYDLDKKLFGF